MRYPYEFEKEFPGKKKRPDYTVTRNGVFLFDVKDVDPYMPLGFAAYDPYPRIREKIEEGREKLKQFKEFPCSLVLKNNGNTFVHLESVDIMLGSMYGDSGFTFPVDTTREAQCHGPSCISARLRCRRCSLTSTKRGAITCSQMFRAVRVALALLSIFSIAYVLMTPAATDDVTAVSQRSHFGKAQKLAVCLVQPLAPQIAIFRLPTPSSSNQRLTALELVDLFRAYRC
jgi:hypothetical protein